MAETVKQGRVGGGSLSRSVSWQRPDGWQDLGAQDQVAVNSSASLEGPEVVTDTAKFPKSFRLPLADLVKAGKLPAVQERVSQDPLVIQPVHEIGKYGGHVAPRLQWASRFLEWLSLLRA